jgi:hypothetical protein
LSTASGIKLGLSVKQLSNIVGKRATTRHATTHYELLCLEKMTGDEIKRFETPNNSHVLERPYFDVGSFVDAHFTSAGASRIDIAKIESY